MQAKAKMQSVTKLVQLSNAAIKREMAGITLSDRMEMLPDAQTKHDRATAIKALEATLKELRKY
jgi:hypothetical protein